MALLDTTCPQCGAAHSKKLSMIYEEGRVSTHSNIQMIETTHTSNPSATLVHGSSTGIQQSEASKAAAPPPIPPLHPNAQTVKTTYLLATIGLFFLVPVTCFSSGLGFFASMGIAIVILIGGLVLVMSQGVEATQEEIANHMKAHPEAYAAVEQWKKTFGCMSCGHRFIPDGL